MKNYIIFVIGLFIFNIGYSQDNQTEIKLNENEYIIEYINLEKNGFLVKIGKPFNFGRKNKDIKIQRYDAKCNLIWENKIDENYPHSQNNSFLIASPNGSVVYFIEIKDDIYSPKTQYVTQFDNKGVIKKLEITGKEEFGKNLQSVFCDNDYLYYLTSEDGNELSDKKKLSEKLVLNRFSNSKLSHTKIFINVPPITDGKITTFWSFLGQKENENYLLSKKLDNYTGKCNYTVAVFNQEGKIVKNIEINLDLQNKYLRPGFPVISFRNGHENVSNLDYRSTITTTNSGSSYPRNYPLTGGFSNLIFDPVNDVFYAFGLFGRDAFRTIGPTYEGFYVYKYNSEGKQIWELKQMASKELLDEGFFTKHGTPGDRNILLRPLPGGGLNFSIQFISTIYSHEISSEGKLLQVRSKKKWVLPTDNLILLSTTKLKSEAYMKAHPQSESKNVLFGNYLNEEGEVLVEMDKKAQKIKFLYFKNNF